MMNDHIIKMMRALRLHILTLVFILLMAASPATLSAKGAYIGDIIVTNSTSSLLLYFNVRDCFTKEIETGIQNGIPATFTFYVELYQSRTALPDKEIASHTFYHTLEFDSLKDEYHIRLSEKNDKILLSLNDAKSMMAEVGGFEVASLQRLRPDHSYRLRVKAKLAKKTLPLYFHYLIPFTSLWDFETDWHTIEFRY